MILNKILTRLNASLKVAIYGLKNQDGSPQTRDTLEGSPLGTSDESGTGEIGVKCIIIANRGSNNVGGFTIGTYDTQVISYVGSTNNIDTIVFKFAGNTVNTLTYSYVGSGASNDDLIDQIVLS